MVTINSFIWKKQKHPLYPPILFKCGLNEETGFWEVIGDGPYEDLLVSGEKLSDALQILKEEILPILWEDCMIKDNVKLSKRAERMTVDLKNRVEQAVFKNKKS